MKGTFIANHLLLLYNQRENNRIYHFLRHCFNSHEIIPIEWELLKYSVCKSLDFAYIEKVRIENESIGREI